VPTNERPVVDETPAVGGFGDRRVAHDDEQAPELTAAVARTPTTSPISSRFVRRVGLGARAYRR